MFRRIAEWITGFKRRDDRHPLDYVDRKAEQMHAPYAKAEPTVPKVPVSEPLPEIKPVVEQQAKVFAEGDGTKVWPFPTSPAPDAVSKPDIPATETKAKKPRKPRAKKVKQQ